MSTNEVEGPFVLVAGADFTPASDAALDQAVRIASRVEACRFHVIHATPPGTSEARLSQIATELETYLSETSAALGIRLPNVEIHVRSGNAPHEIAVLAAEVKADAIVVGTARPRQLRDLFRGSVAGRVQRMVTCPVLVATPKQQTREVHEPVVEPRCKDCDFVRTLSASTQPWCARHSEHHAIGHRYAYRRELPFAQHDSAIIPTGVDAAPGHGG